MEYIYHLLPSHTTHLTPSIIRSFIIASKYNHYFLIYLNDPNKKGVYTSLFENNNYSNYAFLGDETSFKDRLRYLFLEIQYPRYHLKHSDNEKKLYGRLLTIKIDNLVIHGELGMYGTGIYKTLLAASIPTVWVCWGNIPSLHRSFYYKFTTYHYKILFLKKLFCICTLTEKDKINIQELFGIKNVLFCPYFPIKQLQQQTSIHQNKILVGNSGHYIDSYFDVIELLKSFTNIDITFMVPYGLDNDYKRGKYAELKQIAHKYWGDNVHFWDKLLTYDDYKKELLNYSVYICDVNRQTGLGAANHCLFYGLKVYLKGTNYDHYIKNGYAIHHIDEIKKMSSTEELFNISENEMNNNKQNYLEEFNRREQRIEEWESIFEKLLHDNKNKK